MPLAFPLVCLVIYIHRFWHFILGNYTIVTQCILYIGIKSEWIFLVKGGSLIRIRFSISMGTLIPLFLIGILLLIIFLGPLILTVRVMVQIDSIKVTIHVVLEIPLTVRSTFIYLILGLIDDPRLNIFQYLNITVFGLLSSSILNPTAC